MKEYLLNSPDTRVANDLLMAVFSLEQLSGPEMPYKIEGVPRSGGLLCATLNAETGGYLNISEASGEQTVRQLEIRGVMSTFFPEKYDGPRNITGAVSFTPKPTFLDTLISTAGSGPSPKEINYQTRALIGQLLVISAKEFKKKDAENARNSR